MINAQLEALRLQRLKNILSLFIGETVTIVNSDNAIMTELSGVFSEEVVLDNEHPYSIPTNMITEMEIDEKGHLSIHGDFDF